MTYQHPSWSRELRPPVQVLLAKILAVLHSIHCLLPWGYRQLFRCSGNSIYKPKNLYEDTIRVFVFLSCKIVLRSNAIVLYEDHFSVRLNFIGLNLRGHWKFGNTAIRKVSGSIIPDSSKHYLVLHWHWIELQRRDEVNHADWNLKPMNIVKSCTR